MLKGGVSHQAAETTSLSASEDSFYSCNTSLPEDGFLDLDIRKFDDFIRGEVERSDVRNNENHPLSFLRSKNIFERENDLQIEPQSLYDVVKSHHWSVESPHHVTLCASYILSTLKTYGGGIPEDCRVINKMSHLMFRSLDDLHDLLTKMKASSWHLDTTYPDTTSCWNCEAKEEIYKHFSVRNLCSEDRFCTVCLIFVPENMFATHGSSEAHIIQRKHLIDDSYPFSCCKCEMRYCREQDLKNHLPSHNCDVNNIDVNLNFKPFVCFLCRVPFKSKLDLKKHHDFSREHNFRRDIAMEVAMRRKSISEEDCKGSKINGENVQPAIESLVVPELTGNYEYSSLSMNLGQEEEQITAIETIKKYLSGEHGVCQTADRIYSCTLCKFDGDSCTMMHHVLGKGHLRASKAHISSNPNNVTSNQRKEDLSCTLKEIERHLLAEYGVPCIDGKYICLFCGIDNTCPSVMMCHVVGKKHVKKRYLAVSEEKGITLESTPKSQCNLSYSGSTPSEMKMERSGSVSFIQNECRDQVKEPSYTKCEETQHGGTVEKIERPSSYYCTPCSVNVPISNRSEHKRGKNHIKHTSVAAIIEPVCGKDNDKELREAISEYFALDGVYAQDITGHVYACTKCCVTCNWIDMFSHVVSKNHAKKHVNSSLNFKRKFELLSLCEQLRNDNHSTLIPVDKSVFSRAKGQIALVRTEDMKESTTLVPKQAVYINSNKETFHVGRTLNVQDIQGKCIESESKHSEDTSNKRVINNKTKAIVIGDSVSASLKEEFDQVCADKDVGSFELECEVCGVAFPIFNEDIELSVDMHVQNDPVHSLATAVPVERNVQCIAEVAKAAATSVPSIVKLKKSPKMKLSYDKERNAVVSEVLLLEQKFISKQRKFCCELCDVTFKTEQQIFNHVLSRKHLSDKWLEKLTYKELQQRSAKLYSLLKHKYAVNCIYSAVQWIRENSVKNLHHAGQSNSNIPKVVSGSHSVIAKVSLNSKALVPSKADGAVNPTAANCSISRDMYCVMCSKHLDHLTKNGRKAHRRMCKKLQEGSCSSSDVNICKICSKDLSSMAEASRRQHRQDCSVKLCEMCSNSVAHLTRNEKKAHRSKCRSKLHEGCSTSSNGRFCQMCSKDLSCMTDGGRQQHKNACSAKNSAFKVALPSTSNVKDLEAKPVIPTPDNGRYCLICRLLVEDEESHVNGEAHKTMQRVAALNSIMFDLSKLQIKI